MTDLATTRAFASLGDGCRAAIRGLEVTLGVFVRPVFRLTVLALFVAVRAVFRPPVRGLGIALGVLVRPSFRSTVAALFVDFLYFVDYGLAIFTRKVPAGFFIEVVNGSDEIVVGSVADQFECFIQHHVRIAKTPGAVLSVRVLASLSSPAIEPLSKYLVVFVGNVVLRLRPMRPSSRYRVGDLYRIFRIAETIGHGEE